MQTVSIPAAMTSAPPVAAPAAAVLPVAPKPEPIAASPVMPRYGYPPYPYQPYAWPGYPYPVMLPPQPPVSPPAVASKPVEEVPKEPVKAEAEKPVEKPKTAEEKAEDELVDVFRQFLRSNPKLKAVLTPELVQELRSVADNPAKMKDMLIQAVAKGQVGQQVKHFMGTGFLSRMAQKFMLWMSPPQTDPLLSGFFKQIGI